MNKPVVLITGALTGIGRATAFAFAHEGARVVVSGRHEDEGQKLATELRNLGTEAEFVRTDVRNEEEVKNLVDEIIARFGRLDIAINNAGTVGTPGSAADVTPESYQAIFDTNVLGVLLSMKYEIRAMLRQSRRPDRSGVCRQQACRRRHHEVCGHRTRRHRRSCQHRWPWSNRNANVQQLCANAGKQSKLPREPHSYQAHGDSGRDCKCHRVHRL
jgi:NAD(P)-dependent dehydrogenase (short-subunit alcohol dehydrogenase family)